MTDAPVPLVTAASRGMGRAIAEELHGRGHRLALTGTSEEVTRVASELGAISGRGSIADPAHIEEVVQRTLGEYGRIDGVVNNTGHAAKGELLGLTDEDWHAGLDALSRTARTQKCCQTASWGCSAPFLVVDPGQTCCC